MKNAIDIGVSFPALSLPITDESALCTVQFRMTPSSLALFMVSVPPSAFLRKVMNDAAPSNDVVSSNGVEAGWDVHF